MGTQFEARVWERLEGASPPGVASQAHAPPPPAAEHASSPQTVTAKSFERLTPSEPSTKRFSAFTTGSGAPVAVSDAARARAHRLFHELPPAPPQTPQAEMVRDEWLTLCAALRVADGDIALSDELHAEMEDDVERRGGDVDRPSDWLARFKSLLAALEDSASGLPDPSMRLAFAERELVRRRKLTAEQVRERTPSHTTRAPPLACDRYVRVGCARPVAASEGDPVDVRTHRRSRGLRAVAGRRGRVRRERLPVRREERRRGEGEGGGGARGAALF